MCRQRYEPGVGYPPGLDLSYNKALGEREEDSDLITMLGALAVLASKKGGKAGNSWTLEERMVLLEALCNLAAGSVMINDFLDKQVFIFLKVMSC